MTMKAQPPLSRALAGEVLGTYLLVLFGTGSVAAAVLTGAQMGLWQVAVVWGFGVTIAIYASAALSGAHLNPAVSLAFALWRRQDFPLRRLLPYTGAQLVGAVLAGLTVAWLFWPVLLRFEIAKGLVRGAPGSELSAMIFGEYFPNPAMFGTGAAAHALVTPWHAACVEGFGTAVLVLVIFALTAPRNTAAPGANLVPFLIGFTVAVLISLFAPLTQAGWNPARDFGPRVVAYTLGWGPVAIPGPRGGFWVYIVGPLVGGPLGGLAWELLCPDRRENRHTLGATSLQGRTHGTEISAASDNGATPLDRSCGILSRDVEPISGIASMQKREHQ
jgi:glycerol uptake facilitator protein